MAFVQIGFPTASEWWSLWSSWNIKRLDSSKKPQALNPHLWGYLNSWMVCKEKHPFKMDALGVLPWLSKPHIPYWSTVYTRITHIARWRHDLQAPDFGSVKFSQIELSVGCSQICWGDRLSIHSFRFWSLIYVDMISYKGIRITLVG